jgi:hypothetical protein
MKRTSLVACFSFIVIIAFTPFAFGQSQPALSPHLVLARLCVSEAGWDCFERGDGYAIHEVLLRGARRQGVGYTFFARAYAQRLFGARPHDSARLSWVSQLDERGSTPPSWPRVIASHNGAHVVPHPSWATFRSRWLAVLERAREVVTWSLDDIDEWGVCDGAVHDWGGWMDRDRARRLGLIKVECGVDEAGTRNDFYARPSLLREAGDL